MDKTLLFHTVQFNFSGFLHGASGKESTCQCGRRGFHPWSIKSSGEGNGNPLQYSCLENPVDRGA